MSTRADNFTQTKLIPDLFSDFLDDLTPHPITKDLVRVKNEQSIKQALKNLLLTNLGERRFNPNFGSDVNNSLFEPNDVILQENLRNAITNAIRFHEPRVNLLSVQIYNYSEEDRLAVNLIFSIINSVTPQSLNLILRRVR
jgi:phage baseplate assembly protein W